ncbi:ABCB family ABC transporter ATP-binding protein/permease [Hydromonas duriensis]|uniref:ATP-binding cassette subfamily B protein n=1 Tax=Hydromonas duriensis TaxID=1527608 RepID=A0A4R6Y372_9BURK|nr:ABC transporter ATP-binding protein/permease [Hydromonas duriensis]TDR30969.1 ATP-binding cassette subfamily B protein [Hydromonas duriensis]
MTPNSQNRSDWQTIKSLWPYIWRSKYRVMIAFAALTLAKLANLGIPVTLKKIIDGMTPNPNLQTALIVPIALLVAYGGLRISMTLFNELREMVFFRVSENAARTVSLQVFNTLHNLSLKFHLSRQTGGLTRDIERGTRGVRTLIGFSFMTIVPTLIEMCMVLGFLWAKYDVIFVSITALALVCYIAFTVGITEWRTQYRKRMNEMDSNANQKAIDSLLNFETVKYFNNEAFEAQRYDQGLKQFRSAAIQSQNSLSLLNFGQQMIISIALIAILWYTTRGVVAGKLTLGDLVLVNTLMLQLYVPLNFLGVMYRELKQSLVDVDKMFNLLHSAPDVLDAPDANELHVAHGRIEFKHVHFSYNPNRQILHDVSFVVEPNTTTAIVGKSGAGKSTLSRLLFRFYDIDAGDVLIDGQSIAKVTQTSLRRAIGIVPQDTVLFNDSLGYNIQYGRPDANATEVRAAASAAHLDDFLSRLPEGLDTAVGERGLKISGGEKQRVAIARTLLKNTPILIFDEATSALDSHAEKAIQSAFDDAARNRTTLIVAHRLSTIIHADQILVMEAGRIIERGTHAQLLAQNGSYAAMWAAQQEERTIEAVA